MAQQKAEVDVVKLVKYTISDLNGLIDALDYPENAFSGRLTSRALVRPRELDEEGLKAQRAWLAQQIQKVLRFIRDTGGQAKLSAEEEAFAKVAVLLDGRPALVTRDGIFQVPPRSWDILNQYRREIQATFKCVGRIDLPGLPGDPWVGTGFLAGPGVIMTNFHVARTFCDKKSGQWQITPGRDPCTHLGGESGQEKPTRFGLTELIGVDEKLDIALFRVAEKSETGEDLPAPLEIEAEGLYVKSGRPVCTIGFPDRPDPQYFEGTQEDFRVIESVFLGKYGQKCLEPGLVMALDNETPQFLHDCATVGGNSGSCLIDVESQMVIGLHFSGLPWVANRAVALWQLTEHPLLKAAGVNFIL